MGTRTQIVWLAFPLVLACNSDGGSDAGTFDAGASMTAGATDGMTAGMTAGETGADPDTSDGSTGAGDTDTPPETTGPEETTGQPSGGDHALARVAIGETHVSGEAAATAVLSAAFFPDAATIEQGCGMDVSGCTVSVPPTCAVACVAPEACVYDDACLPMCQAPCDLACPAGQECYYPIAGATACKPSETFDGGRLDFFGTTEPISLYPPYAFPVVAGTITQPNADLSLAGSGAAGAGFAPFDGAVTAADSLITNLSMVLPATAFGAGDLAVTWAAGTDDISGTAVVTGATGISGSVTCTADDAAGMLSFPRAAINAAIPMDTASSIAVTLERRRTQITEGAMTQGALLEETVQPEGWVEFSFTSSETFTFIPE